MLCLRRHAPSPLLQGTVNFEQCMPHSYSIVHLFITPPGFWFALVVLGQATTFGGSIHERTLQFWPSWLNSICSITICTRSGGNCSCNSHRFYLEGRLELSSSSWIPEFPGLDAGWELRFFRLAHFSLGMTFMFLTALLTLLWYRMQSIWVESPPELCIRHFYNNLEQWFWLHIYVSIYASVYTHWGGSHFTCLWLSEVPCCMLDACKIIRSFVFGLAITESGLQVS